MENFMEYKNFARAGIIFSCLIGNFIGSTGTCAGKDSVSIFNEKDQKKIREDLFKKYEKYEEEDFLKNYQESCSEKNQKIIDSNFPFLEEINKLEKRSKILDLESRLGTYSKELAKNFNVVSIEGTNKWLAWGVKNKNYNDVETVIQGELKDVPEELRGYFDAIFSYDFQGLWEKEPFFKKLHEVLKPGSKAYLVVRAHPDMLNPQEPIVGSYTIFYESVELFEKKALKYFENVKIDYKSNQDGELEWCILILKKQKSIERNSRL
jgi:SAM-dependent methyltransferase